MDKYDIEEVLDYAKDLKREFVSKNDIDEFNQAIMRLASAVRQLHVVESFDNIRE